MAYPPSPTGTNGLAIASMVLGIVGICGIGSILALVFGYRARRQIDESQGTQTGRGMAIAGIVLGWVGVGIVVVYLVVVIILAISSSDSSDNQGLLRAGAVIFSRT